MKLFKPDFNLEIISEKEYPERIENIEKALQSYAAEGILTLKDGMKLAWRYFLVEKPKASVIIVHGFSEFYRKYDELCWYLLKMGYNVFQYDQRGHGLSGREVEEEGLAHVNSFGDYARDLGDIIENIVVPNMSNTRLYALTHSMGGSVVSLYLNSGGRRIDKVIMSSPMISPYTGGIPIGLAKKLLSHDAEKTSWNARFRFSGEFSSKSHFAKNSDLSRARHDHIRNIRLSEKRYQCCSSTNSWVYNAICVDRQILDKKALSSVSAKVMILSAGKDTVVKNSRQKKLSRILGCPMVTFKGAKHSIFMSDENILGKYMGQVLSFFAL